MGRGKAKIKFNVADMILQGSQAHSYIPELVRSPMFPVAAAMFNRAANTVRIGDVKLENNEVTAITLSTLIGLPIARVTKFAENYHVYISTSPLFYDLGRRLSTTNPAYAKNKLKSGSEHEVAEMFTSALNTSTTELSSMFYRMVDNLIDLKAGSSLHGSPVISSMSDELVTFIARVIQNEASLSDMPMGMRSEFDNKFNEYSKKRGKFTDALGITKEFAEGDKMVLIENATCKDACIFGTVKSRAMLNAIDTYANHGRLPSARLYDYAEVGTPLKWYPSYDAIPEEFRRQLDFAKVVLRNHDTPSNVDNSYTSDNYWLSIGAYKFSSNNGMVVNVFTM